MLKSVFLLGLFAFAVVAHVRVRQPPQRSSLWRDPAFASLNLPANYNDDGLYCGRVHQDVKVSNCGICGDPESDPRPRDNEYGGTYGKGVIAARYSPGQLIPISVEFTTAHLGYFEIHFCDRVPESDDCFRSHPVLTFGDGETKQYPNSQAGGVWINTTLQLPSGVHCDNCVLRLQYRAGNNWGNCGNGTEGMGCGLQETFRNCIDIAIQ